MITDLTLRWIVTALFTVSAVECGYAIVSGNRQWTRIVGRVLHAVMAVAMIAMAWPATAGLPTTGPLVFFLLAAVWFVVIAARDSTHRAESAYHSVMMLAMSWMYLVMSGALNSASPGHAGPSSMPDMPGMDMSGMAGHAATPLAGPPPWVDVVTWLSMVGFAVATGWWLYRALGGGRGRPDRRHLLAATCQAGMAAGTAIMFGALLYM